MVESEGLFRLGKGFVLDRGLNLVLGLYSDCSQSHDSSSLQSLASSQRGGSKQKEKDGGSTVI